jgi:hypothetical protein
MRAANLVLGNTGPARLGKSKKLIAGFQNADLQDAGGK